MKRRIKILAATFFAGLSAVAISCETQAQESNRDYVGASLPSQRISLGVGISKIIDLPEDAAQIFVANPKVANAVVRSPRRLFIIGMDTGQTSIYALDERGGQFAAFEVNVGRDVGGLQQILKAAMPNAAIFVRIINDTIILTGTVDSAEEAQRAGDIAGGFVQRIFSGGAGAEKEVGRVVNTLTIRGRDQVMLKVTLAEIDRNIAKQLGLTQSSLSASWGTFTQYNPFAIGGPIAQSASGVATALSASNPSGTLSATLQAFERYGVTRILAEPTVSAVSGESAKLTVGGEIPIPQTTCQNGSCSGGAAFQDYGVTLRFTPIVLSEGRIELHLATEVTDIDSQNGQTIYGTFVPGLLTRKNETTVEVPSGGSIASAGLLQTVSRQVINGLPGLLDLPVLGALFRSRDYQRQETELLVIVTPYIAKAVKPGDLAKPTDGFADSTDPQAWLLGRVNQLYASPGNPQAIKDYKGPVGFIQD
ncbi:MAG TPA: type II and III secretion system protein family protein [Methylocella sp.]|nr:type II and III secretion system protein family protein [Methylocella sp.]